MPSFSPSLNKDKLGPFLGPIYFSWCSWHRRDPAIFSKIGLNVLSGRISIFCQNRSQNWSNLANCLAEQNWSCCCRCTLSDYKGSCEARLKIRIKRFGGAKSKCAQTKLLAWFCWKLLGLLYNSHLRRNVLVSERGNFCWVKGSFRDSCDVSSLYRKLKQ